MVSPILFPQQVITTASQRILTVMLVLLSSLTMVQAQRDFCIASYNVENLFDCEDDPATDDNAFLPTAPRHWSRSRMWHKLQCISKTIISMGNDTPPDIVALAETENDSVLTLLTQRSVLRRAGYRFVITNSNDRRGIDVALLYQPSTFRLLAYESIPVNFGHMPPRPTRDILHVQGITFTGDTLLIYVCHLSSKLGGAGLTGKYRRVEALTVAHHLDSLLTVCYPTAHAVVLGDFNEEPHELPVTHALQALPCTDTATILPHRLYYMIPRVASCHPEVKGSYRYQGHWQLIDRMFVSGSLLNGQSALQTHPSSFHIHCPSFLLKKDDVYGGVQPFRTYNGFRYQAGFSDHLPVFLKLKSSLRQKESIPVPQQRGSIKIK
ncbi:MAG: endonuclease/exonuclease/phosphatase family protein [Bacteroidaceae bacterium]|nr:endonuclease/exonuclease/phosphatase family protein [Bacteroidaceae bacterium]